VYIAKWLLVIIYSVALSMALQNWAQFELLLAGTWLPVQKAVSDRPQNEMNQ
jgi:predicted anti-sigma-YlaC factor YlaD